MSSVPMLLGSGQHIQHPASTSFLLRPKQLATTWQQGGPPDLSGWSLSGLSSLECFEGLSLGRNGGTPKIGTPNVWIFNVPNPIHVPSKHHPILSRLSWIKYGHWHLLQGHLYNFPNCTPATNILATRCRKFPPSPLHCRSMKKKKGNNNSLRSALFPTNKKSHLLSIGGKKYIGSKEIKYGQATLSSMQSASPKYHVLLVNLCQTCICFLLKSQLFLVYQNVSSMFSDHTISKSYPSTIYIYIYIQCTTDLCIYVYI